MYRYLELIEVAFEYFFITGTVDQTKLGRFVWNLLSNESIAPQNPSESKDDELEDLKTDPEPDDDLESFWKLQNQDLFECRICFESISTNGNRYAILEQCNHLYCELCFTQWIGQNNYQPIACPTCRVVSSKVAFCRRLFKSASAKVRIACENVF